MIDEQKVYGKVGTLVKCSIQEIKSFIDKAYINDALSYLIVDDQRYIQTTEDVPRTGFLLTTFSDCLSRSEGR